MHNSPFSYCLLDDVNSDDVELFDLYVATEKIDNHCYSEEPLPILPLRTQRVWVSYTGLSLMRYPLEGNIIGASYVDSNNKVKFVDLTDSKDKPTVRSSGRLIQWQDKHIGKYMHIVADAGWGYHETLGYQHAELDSSVDDIVFLGGKHVSTTSDPAAVVENFLPEKAIGMVLRMDSELMLVTSDRKERPAHGDATEYYYEVLRGTAATTPTEHDADTLVKRVVPPPVLEDAARGIAATIAARSGNPVGRRGRSQVTQDGDRPRRSDPFDQWLTELDEYKALLGG